MWHACHTSKCRHMRYVLWACKRSNCKCMRQIHKTCLRSHGMAWTCRISSCIQYHPITSMCCSLFAVKHMPIAIMQWYQHILVHVTLKILVTCFIPCEHSLSNHVGHSMPTFFIVQADGVWATSSAHFHALKLCFKSCVAIAKTTNHIWT